MITALTIGPVHTLTEDVVYAMPPVIVQIAVEPEDSDIEGSLDGTNWTQLEYSSTNSGIILAAPFPFIRAHGDDATVRLVRL